MPHMVNVGRQLNTTIAALKVAEAEDGSYDFSPRLNALTRRLQQQVEIFQPLIEQAVSTGGVAALNEGLQYDPIVAVAGDLLDVLSEMREKADARVSRSAASAANEAMGQVGSLVPMMHPDTIMPIVVDAIGPQQRSNA